jgi:hypothetical protein
VLSSGTSAIHLSRTDSRLKGGWVGAYVTTSFLSSLCQKEILRDQYPLLTVDGKVLSTETLKLVESVGEGRYWAISPEIGS